MKKIAVYTCITGDYDDLQELEFKEKNVDYYCFTNNKNIKSNTWKVVYIEDKKLDNQRLSRKIKMLGHPIINDNYEISVWMDASVVWKKSIVEFVKKYLKNNSFASFKHFARNCIYEEAKECIRLRKDDIKTIEEHIKFLKKESYPENNGLYEMTVFIKKHNDPIVKETMEIWYKMVCEHSKRDQLSFMYAVWKTKLKIDKINLVVWNNDWFKCRRHNANSYLINDYGMYFGDVSEYNYKYQIFKKYKIKNNTYIAELTVPVDTNIINFEISNNSCTLLKSIKLNGKKIDNINYIKTVDYNNCKLFYDKKACIIVNGNFKKGNKIKFELEMEVIHDAELYEIIENLSIRYNSSKKEEDEMRDKVIEYEKIINSRSYKLIQTLKKFKINK